MIDLDETTWTILKRFRFEPTVLERMRANLAGAGPTEHTGRLTGPIGLPTREDLVALPPIGSPEGKELAAIGCGALARGEVGVVVLAGGMATRFGGVVKAVVEVVPGSSFLRLKLADIQTTAVVAGCTVPVILLTSFSTSDEIRRAMRDVIHPRTPIEIVEQSVTMRLTSAGEVFHDALGRPSLCATGHGDLLPSLRVSGALKRFRAGGRKMLMVSNVDNLAASLDPRVIGAHVRGGKGVTVEVVAKTPGDRGGIPARVDGQLQIVEEFRLPEGFDSSQVPYFNTNTFVFDTEAIDRDFDLDWFSVRRKVDGQETIQSERLLGQVTASLPTQFLVVERQSSATRFLPVKDREELQLRMPEIQALLQRLGVSLQQPRSPSSDCLVIPPERY
jgi:UTP--glucose-1-phosphate uridylyltransferase